MPYSPTIFYTNNGMGKVFFWVFALFPWNPLTKGVLDMSAASENPTERGRCSSNAGVSLSPGTLQKAGL